MLTGAGRDIQVGTQVSSQVHSQVIKNIQIQVSIIIDIMLTGAGRGTTLFFSTSMVSAFRMSYLPMVYYNSSVSSNVLQELYLRILIIVPAVVLEDSSVHGVAKLLVKVDGNLVAHPGIFPRLIINTTYCRCSTLAMQIRT